MWYWGQHYVPYRQANEQRVFVKYSQHRIRQILRDDYHYELVPIWAGYKGNRCRAYVQHYKVRNFDTGEIIVDDATLNGLRIVLGREGYPLHEPAKLNQGAAAFLEIVESIKEQSH